MKIAVIVGLWIAARSHDVEACSQLPPCAELVGLATPGEAVAKLDAPDGKVTSRAALTLAQSSRPEHLRALGRALQRPAILQRIMHTDNGMRCLMPPILRALAANPAATARAQFVALITSKAWADHPDRSDGSDLPLTLLRATAAFRSPTPEVIAFWNRLSAPDDGWVNVTVMALAENGSAAAAALFESLLRNPKHDLDTRVSWLHSDLVGNRDRLELLKMAEHLLEGDVVTPIQTAVAEAIFDYRQTWYGTCPGPTLIAGARYSKDARRELRVIATRARAHKPDKLLAAAIAATLAELDQIDAVHQP